MEDLRITTDIAGILERYGAKINSTTQDLLKWNADSHFIPVILWQFDAGGKRLRPALTLLWTEAVGGNPEKENILAAAAGIELIHTYSLIMDDLIDKGDIRRGVPTTRAKFGDEMAILAGMHHREVIEEAARRTNHPKEVAHIFSKAILSMIEGERLDVLFEQDNREYEYFKQEKFSNVTEKDYYNMISAKTGGLIAAACEIGALEGNGTRNQVISAREFGEKLGLAFQIVDDILDLSAKDPKFGKEPYKDIIERKLGNYVIIKATESVGNELVEIMQSDLPDRVEKCAKLLDTSDAFIKAQDKAKEFGEEAKIILEQIIEPSRARDTLSNAIDFFIKRKY